MKIGFAMPSPEEAKSMDEYWKNLEKIAELGYDGVEPLICNPEAMNWKSFSKILEQYNLELSGLRTGLVYTREGLCFSDPDENVRRKAIDRLAGIIKFASGFGKPNILIGLMQGRIKETDEFSTTSMQTPFRNEFLTGQACSGRACSTKAKQALQLQSTYEKREFLYKELRNVKDRIVDCLRNCASIAEKYGIILALEPVNRYELSYNNTVDEIVQMIQKVGSKQIKILIDTFHMNIEEKSITESIIKARDHIGHVHFADSNRQVPGNGHLNFPQIIETLKKVGYHGYITVECEHTSGLNAAAEKAINYLTLPFHLVLPEVHRDLAIHAAESGVSLNRLASSKLGR